MLNQKPSGQPPDEFKFDRTTIVVLCIVGYLMSCVLGSMFLLGHGAGSGGLTLGQFAFVFLIAGPACFAGYVMLQAIGESFNAKVLGLGVVLAVAVATAWAVLW